MSTPGRPGSPRPAPGPATAACSSPAPTLSPRQTPHFPSQPASAPRHPYMDQAIASSRCSLASPSSSHVTAQGLTAAPLLRGGSCNSLPPALCQRPDALVARPCLHAKDTLSLQLLRVITASSRVPARLSQGTSWPVLWPWSCLFQLLVWASSQRSLLAWELLPLHFIPLPTLPLTDKCVTSELLKGIPLATGDTSPEPELLPGGE